MSVTGSVTGGNSKKENELSEYGKRVPSKCSGGVTYLANGRQWTNPRQQGSEGKNTFLNTISVTNQFAEVHDKSNETKKGMLQTMSVTNLI